MQAHAHRYYWSGPLHRAVQNEGTSGLPPLPSQVGGVFCLVLNSQLFYDASACPQPKEAQDAWLEEQLSRASTVERHRRRRSILVRSAPPLGEIMASFAAAGRFG